ncbi:MAG: hypothetical protein ACJ76P_09570 [Actinomycetota bacterium]
MTEGGARRRAFSYRGFRFEKAQAGWDVWRGAQRVGWIAVRAHAKPYVDDLLAADIDRSPGAPERL